MVNTNAATTNDFAPVNQGTVKWFATNAFDELEAYLPGGAGTGVAALVVTDRNVTVRCSQTVTV